MQQNAGQVANDLVSRIYAALLGSGTWRGFLDDLSRTLPNGKGTLVYYDHVTGTGALSLDSLYEPDRIEAYNRYYCTRNPWMPRAKSRPHDVGIRAEQMLPYRELVRTEFYADFMRPQGLESGVGVTVFRDHSCNFMLSVLHGRARDDEAQTAASLLGTLAPHLRNAFAYHSRAGIVANAVGSASDAIGVGVVTIAPDRRVSWANACGQEMLASGDPIGVDARGHVRTRRRNLADAMELALKAAMRGEGAGAQTMTLPPDCPGQVPIRLTLVVPGAIASERFFARSCLAILVEREGRRTLSDEAGLRAAFGLTPAEARLAHMIAQGMRLSGAAETLGIKTASARTVLKRIFAKMDVSRQAELVAKVHSGGGRRPASS